MLTITTASKYGSHLAIVDRPDRRTSLVSCQLLPHGLDRSEIRSKIWRQSNICMDERLIDLASRLVICQCNDVKAVQGIVCTFTVPHNTRHRTVNLVYSMRARKCELARESTQLPECKQPHLNTLPRITIRRLSNIRASMDCTTCLINTFTQRRAIK